MINLAQARELLPQAVATQGPDFVYNPSGLGVCQYEASDRDRNGNPYPLDLPQRVTGCLVGVALDLAGETRHHGQITSIAAVATAFPDMMTVGACKYFLVAQEWQDQGYTWGEALAAAERAAASSLSDAG